MSLDRMPEGAVRRRIAANWQSHTTSRGGKRERVVTASSLVQREGTQLHSLPRPVRLSRAWERLRKEICGRAMWFEDEPTFDFRRLLTHATIARDAGRLMWEAVRSFRPQVLVGPGYGATPLLYAMATAALDDGHTVRVLMVRDKRKEHHQKRWVEGDTDDLHLTRAVLVDDFLKGGSAVALVREALAADGIDIHIAAVAVFFDMWTPLGSRQITVSQMPVIPLFTRHDIGLSRDCFDARPPTMAGSRPPLIAERPRWWRFDLHRTATPGPKSAPLIHDGAVFVADDRCTIWKHDIASGDVLWSAPGPAQPRKGMVQLLQWADGSLVYGAYDGTVTRLDATSGIVLWRWKIDSSVHSTPWTDASSSRIFVNTEQWNEGRPIGHLQCLDWRTGRVQWKLQHAWWPPGSPVHDSTHDVVYATCNDSTLVAADASCGKVLWRVPTKGLVRGRPCAAGDKVIVATELGWLQCFAAEDGRCLWSVRYGRGLWHQMPVLYRDQLLILDGKGHFSAFALDGGRLLWTSRLREAGCWRPVIWGRYAAVLSTGGQLAVLDLHEQVKLWEGRIPGRYRQPPHISQGVLAAASNDSGLLAYDLNDFYAH